MAFMYNNVVFVVFLLLPFLLSTFFCFYIIKPQSHTNVIKHVNWHLPFYRQENKEYINKKKTNTQTRK